MKKFQLFSKLLLVFAMAGFVSCTDDAEPLDPAVLDPILTDCAVPTRVAVSDTINSTTVNMSWLAGSNESSWEIEYGPAGFVLGEGTKIETDVTFQEISGIDATVPYAFYVRALCSEDSVSEWVGPLPINSSAEGCANPANVVVTPSSGSSHAINVNWTAVGNPTYWRIQYGLAGFTPGTGAIVSSTDTFKHIAGLQAGTTYDVYIIASCFTDAGAVWAGPYTVTTLSGPVIDYWPMKVDNQWVFKKDGVSQPAMKITGTDIFGGVTYYAYSNLFGTTLNGAGFSGTIHSRKQGSGYYIRQSATVAGPPSVTVDPIEFLILRDDLPVGGTWTETLTQVTHIGTFPPQESEVQTLGTILEKGGSLTVNGQTYQNVIKASLVQTVDGVENTNYYWFAAEVGPIKVINNMNGTETTQELESYIVN